MAISKKKSRLTYESIYKISLLSRLEIIGPEKARI